MTTETKRWTSWRSHVDALSRERLNDDGILTGDVEYASSALLDAFEACAKALQECHARMMTCFNIISYEPGRAGTQLCDLVGAADEQAQSALRALDELRP